MGATKQAMLEEQSMWWRKDLHGFLCALKEGGVLTLDLALEIVEKPWKWTDEHEAWVEEGRPESFTLEI